MQFQYASIRRLLQVAIAFIIVLAGCDSANTFDPLVNDDPLPEEKHPPIEASGMIAFSINMGENRSRIEYAPFDALDEAVLVSPLGASYSSPRISLDGSQILFLGHDGVQRQDQAFISNLKTGVVKSVESFGPLDFGPIFPEMEMVVWNPVDYGFFYSRLLGINGQPELLYHSL